MSKVSLYCDSANFLADAPFDEYQGGPIPCDVRCNLRREGRWRINLYGGRAAVLEAPVDSFLPLPSEYIYIYMYIYIYITYNGSRKFI